MIFEMLAGNVAYIGQSLDKTCKAVPFSVLIYTLFTYPFLSDHVNPLLGCSTASFPFLIQQTLNSEGDHLVLP